MMETKELLNVKRTGGIVTVLAGLMLLSLMASSGCEQQPSSYTYKKEVVVWPFYDLHRTEGVEDNGGKWQKEKGDCCLLSSWEKEKKYDKDGFLIYRKEKSMFFPFVSESIEEDEKSIRKEGSVLLFPYKSFRDKTVGPEK